MPFRSHTAIILFFIIGSANALGLDSSGRTSEAGAVISDSINKLELPVLGVRMPLTNSASDTLSSSATKSAPVYPGETKKLQLIKRKYNSRQQVLLATGMMIFVVGIMTMAQQWNPR